MTSRNQYLLSLPERVLRSASALSAGLLREIADITLPRAVKRTRLYQIMVESTLRFLIEDVGEVEGSYPPAGKLAEKFLLQRTVGDGIDLAGIAAFHASPVWVLAALADISGASRQLLDEIATTLKEEGLLDRNTSFENIDQVLEGLAQTAGQVANTLRFPPLDLPALRNEWQALKETATKIPPRNIPSPDQVRRLWEDLRSEAAVQGRSVFELSSLITMTVVRAVPANLLWLSRCTKTATIRTGKVFAEGLLEHYRSTLAQIRDTGYLTYWTQEFRPYLRAAAQQFSLSHRSSTERLLTKLARPIRSQTRL